MKQMILWVPILLIISVVSLASCTLTGIHEEQSIDMIIEMTPSPLNNSQLSIPLCSSFDDLGEVGLSVDAMEWLLGKAAELAGKLPPFFSNWAKSGVAIGSGALTPLQESITGFIDKEIAPGEGYADKSDLGSGMQVYLELVSYSQTTARSRWVFRLWSADPVESAGPVIGTLTPVPQNTSTGDDDYYATLRGEILDTDSQEWTLICEDIFLPTVSTAPTALVLEHANCRGGPTTEYPLLSILPAGGQYEVEGRNQEGDSWLVYDPAIEAACWVAGSLVEVTGDTTGVSIIIPELPPPPATEEPVVVDCSQWSSDQPACVANPACTWQPNLYPSDPCRNK